MDLQGLDALFQRLQVQDLTALRTHLEEFKAQNPNRHFCDVCVELASCYRLGIHTPKSLVSSARMLGVAAAFGHADAQYQLGMCYDRGWGVLSDSEHARHLYEQAAAQGHVEARHALSE